MFTAQFSSYEALCSGLREQLDNTSTTVRILMLGDVMAQAGRRCVSSFVPKLKADLSLDFVTLNGENLAGGFGITQKIFFDVCQWGIDCVTMGNHWADKADVHDIKKQDPRLVLPANLTAVSALERPPEFKIRQNKISVSVINLMGLFGMKEAYANPFEYLDRQLAYLKDRRSSGCHVILVDMHAEASSEKQAVACYLDGVASALIGTHTHVPTSDERITTAGTAFVTDIGMTGPYDSIIGMTKERSLRRYFPPVEKKAQEAAKKDSWFNAFLIELGPTDLLAQRAFRLQYREAQATWYVRGVARSP